MKKIPAIILLSVMLASCVDDIYPPAPGPEWILGMNADLYTTDTVHTVYLYYSGHNSVRYADGASITCYVNGTPVCIAEDCTSHTDETSIYEIRAVFHPGDEIRLAAAKDGEVIEADLVVPPTPEIDSFECMPVMEPEFRQTSYSRIMQINIGIRDNSQEDDYYAIEVSGKKICTEDRTGKVMEQSDALKVDVSAEPLFSDSFPSSFDVIGDTDVYLFHDFKYRAFTDNPFKDGHYTLCLRSADKEFFRARHVMKGGYFDEENQVFVAEVEQYTMNLTLTARLSRVSRAVYSNYMMNAFDRTELSDITLFDSYHEYPSNVKGGTGLVNVFSCTTKDFDFEPVHYDMNTHKYPL